MPFYNVDWGWRPRKDTALQLLAYGGGHRGSERGNKTLLLLKVSLPTAISKHVKNQRLRRQPTKTTNETNSVEMKLTSRNNLKE